jgi:hypothetical protein
MTNRYELHARISDAIKCGKSSERKPERKPKLHHNSEMEDIHIYIYIYKYAGWESGSIPGPPSVPRSTKKATRSEPQLSTMCQQIKSKRAQRPSVDKDLKSVEKKHPPGSK